MPGRRILPWRDRIGNRHPGKGKEAPVLTAEERKRLVRIVRDALEAAVRGGSCEPAPPPDGLLEGRNGCFVTLKTAGRLRGCIGCFTATEPLWRTAATYAALSATEDPRFAAAPLRPEELGRVSLDISVLSELEPCTDPWSIELGVHGIYVKQGMRSGCFLPQVATETGWTVEEFWSYCCAHKAGLAPDAWTRDEVEKYTFTAEVVEDPAPEAGE
jgi:AmmeMemoRadiSam system protein A